MNRTTIGLLSLLCAAAPAGGCAALGDEAPSSALPQWFVEAAPAARAEGYPDLGDLDLDVEPATTPQRAALEQELRRTAQSVLADPRGRPGDAGDVEAFIEDARRAASPPQPQR